MRHHHRLVRISEMQDDPDLFRSLVIQLLSGQWPFLSSDDEAIELLPGRLPETLPVDLPLLQGSRVIGSLVRPRSVTPGGPPTGEGIDIVLAIPGTTSEIEGWFERALAEQGWHPTPPRSPLPYGFQQTPLPTSRTYCRGERGPWLAIAVRQEAAGFANVRIYVNTASPGPCVPQPGPLPGMPAIAALMPTLSAPFGVTWSPTGGGSEDRWISEAIAETHLSPGELETQVAQQLAAAGWRRLDGQSEGPVAWSRWRVGSAEQYEGFVFVRELPGSGVHWLYTHVVSTRLRVRRGAPGGWMLRPGWVGS